MVQVDTSSRRTFERSGPSGRPNGSTPNTALTGTFTTRRPPPLLEPEQSVHSMLAEMTILLRRLVLVAEELRRLVPDTSTGPVDHEPAAALTTRQREILRLLAEGHSTASIAAQLWLSRSTVRNHVSAILHALDAHSRLEAVARARSLGLFG